MPADMPLQDRDDFLKYAASCDLGKEWVLLHSGMASQESGRYSYLASHPVKHITSDDLTALAPHVSDTQSWHNNAWFGYLGYELKDRLEPGMTCAPSILSLPAMSVIRPAHITRFDHHSGRMDSFGAPLKSSPINTDVALPAITALSSNMHKGDYLAIIHATIERIKAGDFYQANITRKFSGEFEYAPDAFHLFRRLCETSPAPYSALIRTGDSFILSSSPENFLRIDPSGRVESRPIKGSAPRHSDPVQDQKIRRQLTDSHKDRAENLMIVDLMRNDLSRCCEAGSITVSDLQEVHSFATIHQMISTVSGRKRRDCSTLDVVSACFPPGSMTGAPKIKAMDWISRQEKYQRGVYSGAIGWLGGDGSCELSVVIRTLILQGHRFEFQVGGGIVADSLPEQEWEETLIKARGICRAIGLDEQRLRVL